MNLANKAGRTFSMSYIELSDFSRTIFLNSASIETFKWILFILQSGAIKLTSLIFI